MLPICANACLNDLVHQSLAEFTSERGLKTKREATAVFPACKCYILTQICSQVTCEYLWPNWNQSALSVVSFPLHDG